MKKTIKIHKGNEIEEQVVNYIPIRYIIAIAITIMEVACIIAIVVCLCVFVPYFYIFTIITTVAVEVEIIASDNNPDYKIPWMLFVLILPIIGFMLYFIFSSRTLKKKFVKLLGRLKENTYLKNDREELKALKEENEVIHSQAWMLTKISDTHIFSDTRTTYFPSGESYFESLKKDLENAHEFIYMEYFIIEEGVFWNDILEILKSKAREGLDVKVLYDDIGCMSTLPGDYAKTLKTYGIDALPFSRLKGQADNEFNNRSHRKIASIDGIIAYTGGINIADEYINRKKRFGHWKDVGIRLEGNAVKEFTRLFLIDFGINRKKPMMIEKNLYPNHAMAKDGYVIPFGDGPKPLYERRVGKSVIQNMLNSSTKYMYMTTPYLIIDNDLCTSMENAALRGVDVRIIVPHIPDKKIVFHMTRSYYHRLMDAGVKIYEYRPGFIHAKTYLSDDMTAMVGTINLDYRSLVHHFENGVWMYGSSCLTEIKKDIQETMDKSILVTRDMLKVNVFVLFMRAFVRIFAPLL